MLLFVQYEPCVINGGQSKLIVGTPIPGMKKMAKVNSFDGKEADLMYTMLVGADEDGNVKDVEKDVKNLEENK